MVGRDRAARLASDDGEEMISHRPRAILQRHPKGVEPGVEGKISGRGTPKFIDPFTFPPPLNSARNQSVCRSSAPMVQTNQYRFI